MTTMPKPLRQLLPAAVLAAGVTLGALAQAAPASATWDIEAYDECMKKPHLDHSNHDVTCCIESGGIPTLGFGCRAPEPEAQGATETAPPPKAGIPTALVQPPTVGSPSTGRTVAVVLEMVG
jgi:hypothetical protein